MTVKLHGGRLQPVRGVSGQDVGGLLYLSCTCTAAFCRFSRIEPFAFSKSFETSKIAATEGTREFVPDDEVMQDPAIALRHIQITP